MTVFQPQKMILELRWEWEHGDNAGRPPHDYRIVLTPFDPKPGVRESGNFRIERHDWDADGGSRWMPHNGSHDISTETLLACAMNALALGAFEIIERTDDNPRRRINLGRFTMEP